MENIKKLWLRFGVTLSEPGTWRGFVMILTAFGVHLDPEQLEAIVVAGLAVTGLLNVFFKDESNPSDEIKGVTKEESLSDAVKGTRE